MRRILGLDLGTNSIGWAIVNENTNIEAAGSRIIPMDASMLGDFNKGNSISQTAERTKFRATRRLTERFLLRRERLNRVLDIMGFLPNHYSCEFDRYGKFLRDKEPKIAWKKNELGKYEFVFKESFLEMMEDFRKVNPKVIEQNKKIPYDWTIYYLRKKALREKISKEELAWILLNFNQKRGYNQLRGEDEEIDNTKTVEFHALKVISVEDTGEKKGKETWYNVHLENGWIYKRSSSLPLDWVGKIKEFIVTTEFNNDGTPKTDREGNVKRSFRAPQEGDWTLLKKKTEATIDQTQETVGEYIYHTLLNNPSQKIKGGLIRTIERTYYYRELEKILNKQAEFHHELNDKSLYNNCLDALYVRNQAHKKSISNKDFTHLFLEDILFYQRPLKSKKSLIANCQYEKYAGHPVKCIAKSHPLFQEFRLWQFVSNLRIYRTDEIKEVDVTDQFLKNEEDIVKLFDWLNCQKEIKQESFLKWLGIKKRSNIQYRWNYVQDKAYPCNETHSMILDRLGRAGIDPTFLTKEREEALWHILYSVENKSEIVKALQTFAIKNELNSSFVEVFKKFPPLKKKYGSYSAKAIKKLLPLMRIGKYWSEENIDVHTKERIEKILSGEYDESISNRVREKSVNFNELSDFRGLPLWIACYTVYGRHSEAKEINRWNSPDDIDTYLRTFKQHSLRNPIVEQVIMESLRTVRDIWKKFGKVDEVHIELGREMKNPADKRKAITQRITENEAANFRIKYLLTEFLNPEYEIENVRPYSHSQQDVLRIYEEGVIGGNYDIPDDIAEIIKKCSESDIKKQPSKSEVMRYKLWLEQKYRSPYTGAPISLSKLFTPVYEIEHIIPQSRYFDDSFSNKVICESEVNRLKDNMLGYEFISNHQGEIVELSYGKRVKIFTIEEYECFIKDNYSNRALASKKKKLLLDDIPDGFIERQLNDSRYISKVVKSLLSNIVREDGEVEGISKNVIPCSGGVTDRLKNDWGVNEVWNRLILPRFKRLNTLVGEENFTTTNAQGHEIPNMPLELQKGFNRKRIDHRHHAMDAIVIACATRSHIQLLNNEAAKSENKAIRHQLSRKLRRYEKVVIKGAEREVPKEFIKPWTTFTNDVYKTLDNVVVSFKQNIRVINKATNYYTCYDENGKKVHTAQTKGDLWAIRKPMHKDTVFGEVNLRILDTAKLKEILSNPERIVEKDLKKKVRSLLKAGYDEKMIKKYFEENKEIWSDINLSKIDIYTFTKETNDRYFATRKTLDTSFDKKKIEGAVTDTGIRKILLRHLELKGNDPNVAFSPDGIDEMNRNIVNLNNGKQHQPILKVRVYEKANKFEVGQTGNKSSKFVEAEKGTNLYFAVYEKDGIRSFETIPLNRAIDRQKQGLPVAPTEVNGGKLLFVLSPNDLVYVPTEYEIENGMNINGIDKRRIYKMVSSSGRQCCFLQASVSTSIIDKKEFSPLNKMERAISGEMIKEICIPLKVDRIGQIMFT